MANPPVVQEPVQQIVEVAVVRENNMAAKVPGEAFLVHAGGRQSADMVLFLQQLPIRMTALAKPPRGPQARRPPANNQDFAHAALIQSVFGIYYLLFMI